jgi:crotonobetainyl-CoA:carnitine CoA-transferase CaiB-like acyl-CoA transferase
MSRTPPKYERPAPTLGQDNELILSGRLGLSSEEMAALRDRGVIGTQPRT